MKKKINIALVVAVILLWGMVGYQFLRNYFVVKDKADFGQSIGKNRSISVVRDTFALAPLARDPFLGNFRPDVRSPTNNRKLPRLPILPKQTPLAWPPLKYFGYIKSGNQGELALVKIGEKVYKIKKGETQQDIKVFAIYSDSIGVELNLQRRIITK